MRPISVHRARCRTKYRASLAALEVAHLVKDALMHPAPYIPRTPRTYSRGTGTLSKEEFSARIKEGLARRRASAEVDAEEPPEKLPEKLPEKVDVITPELEKQALKRVKRTGSGCSLYRHFDINGKLLYVGISANALNRLYQHEHNAPWHRVVATTTVEHFDTRAEAEVAEREAIKRELPAHNKAHMP